MTPRRLERTDSACVALIIAVSALVLSGCAPEPTAEPSTTASAASPSASSEPSPSAEPAITLPECESLYSPALVATLESENRENQGDISADGPGGVGTADPGIEAILSAVPERVSCTWILPASESGSTTTVAVLDDASRTALVASLATAGFASSTAPSGDLYTLSVEQEFGTYTEAHLLTEQLWFASVYAGGDATTLTLDAAATVLP